MSLTTIIPLLLRHIYQFKVALYIQKHGHILPVPLPKSKCLHSILIPLYIAGVETIEFKASSALVKPSGFSP